MSSTKSNSSEANPGKPRPLRSPVALAIITIGLLGALVLALNPRPPRLSPAPLRALPRGCPRMTVEFTPSNLTEIPGLYFKARRREEKNRALLRLNMEPCACGCSMSLAACRVSNPSCESSRGEAEKIADEETGEKD